MKFMSTRKHPKNAKNKIKVQQDTAVSKPSYGGGAVCKTSYKTAIIHSFNKHLLNISCCQVIFTRPWGQRYVQNTIFYPQEVSQVEKKIIY